MSRCGFWSWRSGGGTGTADDHIEHKAVADMEKILEILSEIRPADQKAMEAARLRWNSVAKPIGSLGVLEEDLIKICRDPGKLQNGSSGKNAPWQSCAPTTEWWRRA